MSCQIGACHTAHKEWEWAPWADFSAQPGELLLLFRFPLSFTPKLAPNP